jgi:hypothetical protein
MVRGQWRSDPEDQLLNTVGVVGQCACYFTPDCLAKAIRVDADSEGTSMAQTGDRFSFYQLEISLHGHGIQFCSLRFL